MTEKCKFHHLTFATKYSRFPKEGLALRRYNALMEIGNEPLLLDSAGAELIGNAINKQAQKLGIRVVVGNILPDHAHIIIENNDTSIPEIAQRLKGYSSYLYNRTFRHSGPVWVVGYSDTYLDNKKHLENAVEYVKNNHIKHKAKSYYLWGESL